MFQSIYHLLFGKRFEFDTPLDIIETTIRLDHHAIRDASRSRFARSQPNHITVQAKDERTYRFRSQSNKRICWYRANYGIISVGQPL